MSRTVHGVAGVPRCLIACRSEDSSGRPCRGYFAGPAGWSHTRPPKYFRAITPRTSGPPPPLARRHLTKASGRKNAGNISANSASWETLTFCGGPGQVHPACTTTLTGGGRPTCSRGGLHRQTSSRLFFGHHNASSFSAHEKNGPKTANSAKESNFYPII